MRTALPLLHPLLLRHHQTDRHAAAKAFRQRHDVRDDADVVRCKHLTGAPDTGLHLVKDQHDTMPVTQLAQTLQKSTRRNDVAAFTLHRLDQNAGHFLRRHVAREQHLFDVMQHRITLIIAGEDRAIVVRIRHVRDARHRREESRLLRVLARRERETSHRAPVKSAKETNEATASRDVPCELERAFHRFCATLAHEAHHRLTAHRLQVTDTLAESDLPFVPVVARDVEETLRRVGDRLHHVRVRVTCRTDGDAGCEVEEAIAIHIPHFGAASVRHHERVVARV